jgi:hypothetical protein
MLPDVQRAAAAAAAALCVGEIGKHQPVSAVQCCECDRPGLQLLAG